jgi:hypothetical protein
MSAVIHVVIFLVVVKAMKEMAPTKYIVYRAKLRVCDLDHIKQLLRFGDWSTRRCRDSQEIWVT